MIEFQYFNGCSYNCNYYNWAFCNQTLYYLYRLCSLPLHWWSSCKEQERFNLFETIDLNPNFVFWCHVRFPVYTMRIVSANQPEIDVTYYVPYSAIWLICNVTLLKTTIFQNMSVPNENGYGGLILLSWLPYLLVDVENRSDGHILHRWVYNPISLQSRPYMCCVLLYCM